MSQSFAEALSWVPVSATLSATLGRGHDYASAQGHRTVTLEHLLLALADDPDANVVLQASSIDIGRLVGDASEHLGHHEDRIQPDEPNDPGADEALVRILDYAAAAARQSRRREINGAIVLAAIVGEARSVAASMLQAQGLTFEGAIRALQRAPVASQRVLPAPQAPSQTAAPVVPVQPAVVDAPTTINGAATQTNEQILASVRRRIDANRAAVKPATVAPAREPYPPPPVVAPQRPPWEERPTVVVPVAPMQSGSPVAEAAQPAAPAEPIALAPQPAPTMEADTASAQAPSSAPVNAMPAPAPVEPAPVMSMDNGPPPPQQMPAPQFSNGYLQPDPDPGYAPPHAQAYAPAQPAAANDMQRPDATPRTRPPLIDQRSADVPPSRRPPPLPAHLPSSAAPGGPMLQDPSQLGRAQPHGPIAEPPPSPLRPRQLGAPIVPPSSVPWPAPVQPQPAALPPGMAPAPRPRPLHEPNFYDGGIAGAPYPEFETNAPRPTSTMPVPVQRTKVPRVHAPSAAPIEPGQLVEKIPRTMRVGRAETVEVRIARASIKAVGDAAGGARDAQVPEQFVTKALSVRLRSADGGFSIEPGSTETQWLDNNSAMKPDDFANWRWTVTPRKGGKGRLQLAVTARTISTDGLAADTAMPEQVFDIAVRADYGRLLRRVAGWAALLLIGGALSKFGQNGLETVATLWRGFE